MKTTKQTQDAFIASLMPDSDKKMVRISGASLIVALALGFWASTYESIIDEADYIFQIHLRNLKYRKKSRVEGRVVEVSLKEMVILERLLTVVFSKGLQP